MTLGVMGVEPTAGNAFNLFRQKSFNSQIETLLDEITAYNPAMAGEDDAMLWDIPEFTGDMGDMEGDVSDLSAPWKVGRTASVGMITRTLSAGKQQPPLDTKQAWPANVGPCAVCGLVASEISCHECRQNTCAFCDFQVHKDMAETHTARVSLRPAAGKPEWSATIALTNKNGKRPQAAAAPPAAQHVGRTMSAELMGGASLDDAILDFFKTDEFSHAVTKADLEGLPQGFPSQSEIDLFNSDFLPLMEIERPAKMARTTTRTRRTTPKAKPAPKESRPAAPKVKPVTKVRPTPKATRPSSTTHAAVPGVVMKAAPRPTDFQFRLDPSEATAATFRATRLAALERFHRKREQQLLNPKVRYQSRKKIADHRPRVKGRFVKTESLVRAS